MLKRFLKKVLRFVLGLQFKLMGHKAFLGTEWLFKKFSRVGDRPIFDNQLFPWIKHIENNTHIIQEELAAVLENREHIPNFQDISPDQEVLTTDDRWKTFFFYAYGYQVEEGRIQCPKTDALLRQIPGMQTAFFSILSPHKHIPRHRGPFNGVLRFHMGLQIPSPKEQCRISIGDKMAIWEEGKSLVFDDTYYHEVWNDTDGYRVVLFLDIERPFGFPLSLVNATVSKLLTLSPQVKQAKENYEKFS